MFNRRHSHANTFIKLKARTAKFLNPFPVSCAFQFSKQTCIDREVVKYFPKSTTSVNKNNRKLHISVILRLILVIKPPKFFCTHKATFGSKTISFFLCSTYFTLNSLSPFDRAIFSFSKIDPRSLSLSLSLSLNFLLERPCISAGTIPSQPASNCSIARLHQCTVEYTLGDQIDVG